jgi:hypothetical protein
MHWHSRVPGFAPGVPSTANGVIYIPADNGHLYAYADTTVLPATSHVCSYPGLPPDLSCSSAGFQPVDVPVQLKAVPISGSVPGVAAISNGQFYVATTAGHVIGMTP